MFNKEKRLDGILSMFNKAISSLSSLQDDILDDLNIKQDKINKLEEECDTLIATNKKTSKVIGNLNKMIGGNV